MDCCQLFCIYIRCIRRTRGRGLEWDEAKHQKTLTKRTINFFAAIALIYWDTALTRTHSLRDYGEERSLSTGHIEGLLHFYIWDWRGDVARLISLKKTSDDEYIICDKSYNDEDNEAPELDETWFAKAGLGRSKLPIELRK